MLSVGIIGAGPWGTAVLSNLVERSLNHGDLKFSVTVFDPSSFGPGIHNSASEEGFLLNTVAGQIDSFHGKYYSKNNQRVTLYRPSFIEFLKNQFDMIVDPVSFVDRKYYACYQDFVFKQLVQKKPSNIDIRLVQDLVIDFKVTSQSAITVKTSTNKSHFFNHLFLCTGHGDGFRAEQYNTGVYGVNYDDIMNSERVLIQGMGLTAVDAVHKLTIGKGGKFVTNGTDLEYQRSGFEPKIYISSRTNYLFKSRPNNPLDSTGSYRPIICSNVRLDSLISWAVNSNSDMIDFLLEIIELEMWFAYNSKIKRLSSRYFHFESCDDILKLNRRLRRCYSNSEFQPRIYFDSTVIVKESLRRQLESDIKESELGEGISAIKYSIEILRVIRDFVRSYISHSEVAPHKSKFFSRVSGRISLSIVGPPLSRAKEWLALIDAGVINRSINGHSQPTKNSHDDTWVVQRDIEAQLFDRIIKANIRSNKSSLFDKLVESGLVIKGDDDALVLDNCNPFDCTGMVLRNVSILGQPREGYSYFNHYFPSPKSRSKAWHEIEIEIQSMLSNFDFVGYLNE